jgi:hypothetical protein
MEGDPFRHDQFLHLQAHRAPADLRQQSSQIVGNLRRGSSPKKKRPAEQGRPEAGQSRVKRRRTM